MKINCHHWNEFRHEKKNEAVKKIYPDGMHVAIAKGLSASKDLVCRTATLDEPEHGLTEKRVEGDGCTGVVGARRARGCEG